MTPVVAIENLSVGYSRLRVCILVGSWLLDHHDCITLGIEYLSDLLLLYYGIPLSDKRLQLSLLQDVKDKQACYYIARHFCECIGELLVVEPFETEGNKRC